ncbi:alcohol dehydrogenase catalytic domain-containing protein [Tardiphaga sp. 862_B3_N1_1]|uniref:alcohol dehydrogenase catalytic domain-containing protein n=1 Tax=Tardiphaga sp. 862_B3_N1_1 TaxID=3240763 RepID=UPI003F8A4812
MERLMKAAIFERTGERLSIHEVERPTLGDNELLLKVAFTGICGSDLHAAETPGALPPGTIMGHEFTGEVVESTSAGWQIGTRVATNPHWVCEICESGGKCHAGRDQACANSCFMGFTLEVPGAYAEYVRIRASQAIRLPDNVSLRDGALMEPLAVARHAVDICGALTGDSVLVIGGGPIGLGVLLMAIEAGARKVVVSEPDVNRRACALQLGAAAVIDPTAEDLSSAMVRLSIGPPDVVFECVGAPGFLQQTIDVMAVRARAVIVGVCMTEDRLMPRAAIRKEATLRFALGYSRKDFEHVSQYLSRNPEKAAAMVSKVVPLNELPDVFDQLRSQKSLIKVLITPT